MIEMKDRFDPLTYDSDLAKEHGINLMLEEYDARKAMNEILKGIGEDDNLSKAVEAYCEKHLHLFWHQQDFKGATKYYFPDQSSIVDANGTISVHPNYEIYESRY